MAHWDLEPTVSRIVHYVPPMSKGDDFPVCHAAMVTAVSGTDVWLTVMAPYGIYYMQHVTHDETLQKTNGVEDHKEDTWHWPEMVNTGFSMSVKKLED